MQIELKNVCKIYQSDHDIKVNALENVNLILEHGLVAVVGKSGSGKTTLLNLIGGIDMITDGNILYDGTDLNTYKAADYNFYRQNIVSYVFQDFNLLNDLTVIENIKLACRLQGKDQEQVNQKASEALGAVNLSEYANRKINSLSGGQQQRVAIARALAKDSQIVLCDEPTGNLDSKSATEIFELLKKIAENRLVIVVTHDEEYAGNFADRTIRLLDGRVIEDVECRVKTQSQSENSENATNFKLHKRSGLSGKDTLWLIGKNCKTSVFSNLIVMVLLIGAIALSTVFTSLFQYNSKDAFVNTLKSNNEHIIQLTKYKDYPREEIDENGDTIVVHGPEIRYEDVKTEDKAMLLGITQQKAGIYSSYFFDKNFQDFTDRRIYTDRTNFQYAVNSFRELIVVDDFSTFYMPLQYGHIPSAANEVLIYDYMAYSLIYHKVFDCEIPKIVGKTLTDRQTGTSMIISGILGSKYAQFSYIANDNNQHDFEESYLTSLQSIFCKPDFLNSIKKEKEYESIYNCFFSTETEDLYESDVKKLKKTDLENYQFIATVENYENERGVIVDKETVANVMGIGIEAVTPKKAQEFMENIIVTGLKSYFDYSIERNLLSSYGYRVIAVAERLEENVLYFYTPSVEDLKMWNLSLRQYYLSMGDDWALNKDILNKFVYQTHDDAFYQANPNYSFEGYTDYTSYGILIRDADYYLVMVKEFAQNIMIVLICVSAIGMYLYAALQIKRNHYKIGVLKSMGASNRNITLLFGLQILFVAFLAYLISLPVSIGMMSGVNATFIKGVNPNLVFFSITPLSILLIFIFSLLVILISVLVPLIRLYIQSPLSIIRKNK